MTEAVSHTIKPVATVNPLMNFHSGGELAVAVGPTKFTPAVIKTTSFACPGLTNFTITPPDVNTAISRCMAIKWFFTITFSADADPALYPLNVGLCDAPRFMPASQMTTNIQLQINNAGIALNTYYVLNPFSRCNLDNNDLSKLMSAAPSALDEYQNYNDYATPFTPVTPTTVGNPDYSNLLGTVVDPLQSYSEGPGYYRGNRGGFPLQVTVNTINTNTATALLTTMEPLWVSPLNAGISDTFALIGVTNLTVTVALDQIQRIWSHNPLHPKSPNNFRVASVSLTKSPEMHLDFITPSPSVEIPRVVVYPYTNITTYQTTIGDLAGFTAGASTGMQTSNNIQLNSIPNRLLIWLERKPADKNNCTVSDTFFRLDNISITWDNQNGVLSNADSMDLWKESVSNGLQLSWTQWNQTVGSVFIIDLCKNLPLTNPAEAPGLTSNKQLQITGTWTNIARQGSAPIVQPTMWVAVMQTGVMTIASGTSTQQAAVLTSSDVIRALAGPKMTMKPHHEYYGGAMIGGGINRYFNKVSNNLERRGGYIANPAFDSGALTGGRMMSKAALGKRAYEDDEY